MKPLSIMSKAKARFSFSPVSRVFLIALLTLAVSYCPAAYGQDQPPATGSPTEREERDKPHSTSIREMVVKQQISRRRKEHEELLKRGDDALKLSNELELSFSEKGSLQAEDYSKLETLEKLVARIRKDLGGSDDGEELDSPGTFVNGNPQDRSGVLSFLIDSTRALVDELKKMSRFSISAVAVQTSNSVIRFARFLRLRK